MALDQAASGLLGLCWSALVCACTSLLSVVPMPLRASISKNNDVGDNQLVVSLGSP